MAYKNRICGIYKIQNILNDKVYIGSSIHIMNRWSRHRSDLEKNRSTSNKLQLSYNKNGKDNFKFSIIEECSIDELLEREQFYIDLFDSYNKGYNSVKFAGHTLGYSPTQETRDKIRKTMLERNPFKGRKHSEETKELLRIINTGKKLSEEHKKKISENSSRHNLGKKLSDETKKKLSDAHKGKKRSLESIEKGANKNRGSKRTEETKNKMSQSLKGRIFSNEHKKRISESRKGIKLSKEVCDKMSMSRKGRLSSKYNPTPVLQYDLNDNFIKEWLDLYELSQNGFHSSNVSRACKDFKRTAFGFKWKFKNNI